MTEVYSSELLLFTINPTHVASFVAGSVAGASGVIVGHPFDSLKVRLQVGQALAYEKVDMYVVRQLYRGIIPPLLTVGTLQALNFSTYEYFKRNIQRLSDNITNSPQDDYLRPSQMNLSTIFFAGFSTGAMMSIITNPMNIVKIRMQVASEAGLWSCIKDVYRLHGVRSFYRGYWSSFFTDSPGRGIYMWIYEFTKLQVVKFRYNNYEHIPGRAVTDTSYVDHTTRLISAVSAGIFSWLAVYPLDVIKSKVQLDIAKKQYRNSWDCIVKTYKSQGIRGFFRGLSYTLIRAGPVSATILPIYDVTKEYVERKLSFKEII